MKFGQIQFYYNNEIVRISGVDNRHIGVAKVVYKIDDENYKVETFDEKRHVVPISKMRPATKIAYKLHLEKLLNEFQMELNDISTFRKYILSIISFRVIKRTYRIKELNKDISNIKWEINHALMYREYFREHKLEMELRAENRL